MLRSYCGQVRDEAQAAARETLAQEDLPEEARVQIMAMLRKLNEQVRQVEEAAEVHTESEPSAPAAQQHEAVEQEEPNSVLLEQHAEAIALAQKILADDNADPEVKAQVTPTTLNYSPSTQLGAGEGDASETQ